MARVFLIASDRMHQRRLTPLIQLTPKEEEQHHVDRPRRFCLHGFADKNQGKFKCHAYLKPFLLQVTGEINPVALRYMIGQETVLHIFFSGERYQPCDKTTCNPPRCCQSPPVPMGPV